MSVRLSRARALLGSLTPWSLLAIAAAFVLGWQERGGPVPPFIAHGIQPLGDWWLWALRLVVVPLVMTQVLGAIAGGRTGPAIGRLGLRAMGLFLAMLIVAALL